MATRACSRAQQRDRDGHGDQRLTGQLHRYRIEWTASGLVYYADGALVATHPTPIAGGHSPGRQRYQRQREHRSGRLDAPQPVRLGGNSVASRGGDGGQRSWGELSADVGAAGSSVALSVRTGDTPTPDGTWTAWQPLPGTGGSVTTSAYLQYRRAWRRRTPARRRSSAASRSNTSRRATAPTVLFSDDFESGTFAAWTTVNGLTVTAEAAFAGERSAPGECHRLAAVWARSARRGADARRNDDGALQGRQPLDRDAHRATAQRDQHYARARLAQRQGQAALPQRSRGRQPLQHDAPTRGCGTSCRCVRSLTGDRPRHRQARRSVSGRARPGREHRHRAARPDHARRRGERRRLLDGVRRPRGEG